MANPLRTTTFALCALAALSGCASTQAASSNGADATGPAGVTEWVDTSAGRMKAQTFASPEASASPILLVVLHGDAPFNKPSYQYAFARHAASSGDVVAAAILRPGYTDPTGDTSAGERGLTTGDNYTEDRVEMIVSTIKQVAQAHHARAVVLVGHSGGAAISANILALHPELTQTALLVSCPCDVQAWRAHMKALQGATIWDQPVKSLSPIDLAPKVPATDRVRMMVGTADNLAPPQLTEAYAAALAKNGVDVKVVQLPGKDHEIFLEPSVQEQLRELVASMSKPAPTSP